MKIFSYYLKAIKNEVPEKLSKIYKIYLKTTCNIFTKNFISFFKNKYYSKTYYVKDAMCAANV